MKLDTLTNFSVVKSLRPAAKSDIEVPPTLMHVVVVEAEKIDGNLVHALDNWKEIWPAAEVSLKTVRIL